MSVSIANLQRQFPVPFFKIKTAAQKVLRLLKIKRMDLSIVLVGPERMRRINKQYLRHDEVTDVITFEGEIIICPSEAARNARRYGTTLQRELVLYVIHGILHLAGFDDKAVEDALRMRKKEQKLLQEICS